MHRYIIPLLFNTFTLSFLYTHRTTLDVRGKFTARVRGAGLVLVLKALDFSPRFRKSSVYLVSDLGGRKRSILAPDAIIMGERRGRPRFYLNLILIKIYRILFTRKTFLSRLSDFSLKNAPVQNHEVMSK